MKFKIISLDMWNTLIWPNAEYAREREQYISSELSLPIDKVNTAYHKVKKNSDIMAETNGQCLANIAIYKSFLSLLEVEYNWLKLRRGLEKLFTEYPPHILSKSIEGLQALHENGIWFSVASNTNFIRGKILEKVLLNESNISWKFKVFSDEIHQAKPHPRFWSIVAHRARKINVMPDEILHIGDNNICDGSCQNSNMQFCHINKPGELPIVLSKI